MSDGDNDYDDDFYEDDDEDGAVNDDGGEHATPEIRRPTYIAGT